MKENLFIIKIGGNTIDNPTELQSFLKDFASIPGGKILIHGGGKIATDWGNKLGMISNYVDGRRITGKTDIDIVTMVYAGLVNKTIVVALQSNNCNSIGLTGADANIIPADKRPVDKIDFGFVGDINKSSINVDKIAFFLDNLLVPVIAPLTHDGKGQLLNTNADTIAATLAASLSQFYNIRLIYSFHKKGVLADIRNDDSVINFIDTLAYKKLLAEKKISEGMIPKIQNAFTAIENGVNEVLIGSAADLLQNCTNEVQGTLIKK